MEMDSHSAPKVPLKSGTKRNKGTPGSSMGGKQKTSLIALPDSDQQRGFSQAEVCESGGAMGRPRGGGSANGPRGGGSATYGLRRRSGGSVVVNPMLYNTGMELMMECFEDVLSPSQIEAANKAKDEYKKAQKKIEEAKAEVARLATAAQAEAERQAAAKAEAEKQAAEAAAAANLARQISSGNRGSTSPDIMIVGESPPRGVQKVVSFPQNQMSLPKPSSAGTPKEIYRFAVPGQNNTSAPQQRLVRPLQPGMQVGPRPVKHLSGPQQPGTPTTQGQVTIVSGTSGLGIKRSLSSMEEVTVTPTNKKARGRFVSDTSNGSNGGSWVPLDEYYYGKMEGDPTFHEDKGEFRFRCWICTKMLYNNVKAMMHLQGHIDSEKQQNLDLSDLTQCKHCYKQFDTPFEMQTHIEKVHMSNMNILMCRICEKDHESQGQLTSHMRQNHCACEMPYTCQLCHFRSSMYSDVVDHFKKKHDSSDNLLCLYCLRVFHVKFVSQGWGQTQVYYHHLLRHQSKTANRKCTFCKLSFFNVQDMKTHRKTHHVPNQKGVIGVNVKQNTTDQVMIKVGESGVMGSSKPGGPNRPKSLNAPAVSKMLEHRGMRMPPQTAMAHCFECSMLMNTTDHYKKYVQCSMCRFATSCSFAYATHMMGFHSGQLSALTGSVPGDRPLPAPLHCLCGFSSKFGNKIANHLVYCSKRTGYLNKPELPQVVDRIGLDETDPRHKPGASILDVLGLVKKPNIVKTSVEQGEEGFSATPDVSSNIPDNEDMKHTLSEVEKVKTPSPEQDEEEMTDVLPPPNGILSEYSMDMDISVNAPVTEDSSPTLNTPPSLEEERAPGQPQDMEDGTDALEKATEAAASEETESEVCRQPQQEGDAATPEAVDFPITEAEDAGASAAQDLMVTETENSEASKVEDDKHGEDSDTSKEENTTPPDDTTRDSGEDTAGAENIVAENSGTSTAAPEDQLAEHLITSQTEDSAGTEEELLGEDAEESSADSTVARETEDSGPLQAEGQAHLADGDPTQDSEQAGDSELLTCATVLLQDTGSEHLSREESMKVDEGFPSTTENEDCSASVMEGKEDTAQLQQEKRVDKDQEAELLGSEVAAIEDQDGSAQEQISTLVEPSGAEEISAGESDTDAQEEEEAMAAAESAAQEEEEAMDAGEQMGITPEEEQQEAAADQPPAAEQPKSVEEEMEEGTQEDNTVCEDSAQNQKEPAACNAQNEGKEVEDLAGGQADPEDDSEKSMADINCTDNDTVKYDLDSTSKESQPEEEDSHRDMKPEDSRECGLAEDKVKDRNWDNSTSQPENSCVGSGRAGIDADHAKWMEREGGDHPSHLSHKDKRENQLPAAMANKGRRSSGSNQNPHHPYSSSSSSERDRQHSRDYEHKDRPHDHNRENSDHRDYRRDRNYHDRSRDYFDRHNQYDRQGGGRYDNQHGRYQQGGYQQQGNNGSQDRYYNQNRQGNRGSHNRPGYNDRNYYNRGYY